MNGATDDEQLYLLLEGIKQIEAILKAEQKRREESNKITEEYIGSYLDKLSHTLTVKVSNQFQQMEQRLLQVDENLSRVEHEFDQ